MGKAGEEWGGGVGAGELELETGSRGLESLPPSTLELRSEAIPGYDQALWREGRC